MKKIIGPTVSLFKTKILAKKFLRENTGGIFVVSMDTKGAILFAKRAPEHIKPSIIYQKAPSVRAIVWL